MAGNLLTRSIQGAFIAILVGVWYFVTETGRVHTLFLPPLPKVWAEMQRIVDNGQLWRAAQVTIFTIFRAYLISSIAGLLIGFLVSRSVKVTRLLEPIFSGTFAIPLTLFFPLFIFYFGIGPNSKIAYGAVYSFFPIVLTSIAAFANVDRLHIASARSMGASDFQMFRHVYLPSALPVIITGLRIGFFICIASVLGGETLSSAAGVGKAISLSAELMETARMYSWVVFVVLTSFMLNMLVSALETRRIHGQAT